MTGRPQSPKTSAEEPAEEPAEERCDVCGSATVEWRRCKLVCTTCGTILKSCADL